jgi:hypothetical protein
MTPGAAQAKEKACPTNPCIALAVASIKTRSKAWSPLQAGCFCDGCIELLHGIAVATKMVPLKRLVKVLSDGVSALYNNHRSDNALMTRRTIQAQLESAK